MQPNDLSFGMQPILSSCRHGADPCGLRGLRMGFKSPHGFFFSSLEFVVLLSFSSDFIGSRLLQSRSILQACAVVVVAPCSLRSVTVSSSSDQSRFIFEPFGMPHAGEVFSSACGRSFFVLLRALSIVLASAIDCGKDPSGWTLIVGSLDKFVGDRLQASVQKTHREACGGSCLWFPSCWRWGHFTGKCWMRDLSAGVPKISLPMKCECHPLLCCLCHGSFWSLLCC